MLKDDGANVRSSLLRTTHILFGISTPSEPRQSNGLQKPAVPRICSLSTWRDDPQIWCWHCCSPCNRTPLPLPVGHNPKTDVFTVFGCFCSWSCMRAYARDHLPGHVASVRAHFMAAFRKRCEPGWRMSSGFTTAPPRQMLQQFGGPMTIEQFRAASEEGLGYSVLPPKMLPLVQIIEQQRLNSRLRAPSIQNLAEPVSFKDVSQKNESLRLRRSKPLKSDKNVLERAMGINAFLSQITTSAPSS